MIGRVWSADALYDNGAMSKYATLTSISESPLTEGLLYTGSDDGLINVTEDGGQNWRKAAGLPRVPALSFINDIEASGDDANTVFAVADAHKFGDYRPLLFISTDRGRSWRSITGDLPNGTIVWVIKQDHVDPNLLFIGTEFGIYFSHNKGTNWTKLSGGVPTIPFRDLELHTKDNDLVGASFGRGFYVLDDYSSLRDMAPVVQAGSNTLFSVRDAWWYVPYNPMQAKGMPTLGTTSYVAENPPFGAVFTYYLHEVPKTAKKQRQETEKKLRDQNASVPFPGWDRLDQEANENDPQALLLVRDANGDPVRWISGPAKQGLHRVNWDLRYPAPDPINLKQPGFVPPWADASKGPLAAPGKYSVELFVYHQGSIQSQGEAREFNVKPVPTGATSTDFGAVAAFQQRTSDLSRRISGAEKKLEEAKERLRHIRAALVKTPKATPEHFTRLDELQVSLAGLQKRLTGDGAREEMNESRVPSIGDRVERVVNGHWDTRQTPTETHQHNIEIAATAFDTFRQDLASWVNNLSEYESALEAAGAPWTRGRLE